jgi:hypothetical protein
MVSSDLKIVLQEITGLRIIRQFYNVPGVEVEYIEFILVTTIHL